VGGRAGGTTATSTFLPLVALQPVYQHPYTVAKTIASLALLYDRRVCLNLVAGGNRADLAALNDTTEHDRPAGRQAAEILGALPVRYPEPPGPGDSMDLNGAGVRIGVIARDTDEEAWRVAHERFPDTRAGRMLQRMARSTSDSHWVRRLSSADEFPGGPDSPYWMGPFQTYATFCPAPTTRWRPRLPAT
jgi:alkanesulfonate monooxygenase